MSAGAQPSPPPMFFKRRQGHMQDRLSPNPILSSLNRDLIENEMPESLDPKLDLKRTTMFDDEVDPARRHPGTAE